MEALISIESLVCFSVAVPGVASVFSYAALRACGKLSVSAEGWHAGAIRIRDRVIVPAVKLFAWYQPLMGYEARLRRWAGNRRQKRREGISEVIVELVTIG